jgi:hypothetical protein
LVLVEDGEVVGLDVAESYFVAHFSTPGQACRSISLFALSDVRIIQCAECRRTSLLLSGQEAKLSGPLEQPGWPLLGADPTLVQSY